MRNNKKKYNIIKTINDDAPFGNVNWCTISFLTPKKIDSLAKLDIMGIKIHNGYNTAEIAEHDAKVLKNIHKNHDIYVTQIGKIYAWDDISKSEGIEYGNDKMNDLEKGRQENANKLKLVREQLKNELSFSKQQNDNCIRHHRTMERIKKKLYEKNLISQNEYDMIKNNDISLKESRENAKSIEQLQPEIDETYKIDYLDENDPVALKYGCLTIFSTRHIKGLQILCFKIRGIFQTINELHTRIKNINELYPHDRIYTFEVGKWCGFSENDNMDSNEILKRLNLSMKYYITNIQNENQKFNERKEQMKKTAEEESKLTQKNERKKKLKKKKKSSQDSATEDSPIIGNNEDIDAINNLIKYIEDPELKNKYTTNENVEKKLD